MRVHPGTLYQDGERSKFESAVSPGTKMASDRSLKVQCPRVYSRYRIALEIQRTPIGMEIVIEPTAWTKRIGNMLASEFAAWALEMASKVNADKYNTSKGSPKGAPPKRKSGNRGNHVATSQMNKNRKNSTS